MMRVGRDGRSGSRMAAAALTVALGAGCQAEAGGGSPEPAARTPADTAHMYAGRVMEALGGSDAWAATRYISFRWLVERGGQVVADRSHAWDRYDGRYRLAFDQRDTTHLMLFDVSDLRQDPELGKVPTGRAWKGSLELSGAARDSALRRAYGIFVNDTYWALMPFKWEDPGVHLAYAGTRTLADGRDYATVHLTFDQGLGVTEDQYWGFVDPETGLMAAWQYHLGRNEEPDDVIWWRDWVDTGEVRFAMSRVNDDGERFIYFEDVVTSSAVPEGRFEPPLP